MARQRAGRRAGRRRVRRRCGLLRRRRARSSVPTSPPSRCVHALHMHTRGTRYLVITRCRSGTAPNPHPNPNPTPNPKQEWHGAAKTGQLACLERLLAAEPWLLQARYLVITPTSRGCCRHSTLTLTRTLALTLTRNRARTQPQSCPHPEPCPPCRSARRTLRSNSSATPRCTGPRRTARHVT